MHLVETREFDGDPAAVWARVSNVEAIPSYWHGTKELKVTGRGEKTTADVVFAFGGKGEAQITVDQPSRTLTIEYLDGPFKGRQSVEVKEGTVEARWDIAFAGAFKLLAPWNASHFRSGTRNALRRLCEPPAAVG